MPIPRRCSTSAGISLDWRIKCAGQSSWTKDRWKLVPRQSNFKNVSYLKAVVASGEVYPRVEDLVLKCVRISAWADPDNSTELLGFDLLQFGPTRLRDPERLMRSIVYAAYGVCLNF